MNKKIDFILCLTLGYLGIHKFYEKKISMSILYLFTGGLFFIGWIYDCIQLGIGIYKEKDTIRNVYSQETSYKDREEEPIIQHTLNSINIETSNNKFDNYSQKEISKRIHKMTKREELANAMNPSPLWNESTETQQEFATDLVDKFCDRFAKYLCWGIRDHIIASDTADDITNALFMSIDTIDDAKWWCNKKTTNDFTIASKLLEDDEIHLNIIKKLKKEYN